jgi:hypothetical protein
MASRIDAVSEPVAGYQRPPRKRAPARVAPVVSSRPRTPGAPGAAGALPRHRTAYPGHLPRITGVPGPRAPGRTAGAATDHPQDQDAVGRHELVSGASTVPAGKAASRSGEVRSTVSHGASADTSSQPRSQGRLDWAGPVRSQGCARKARNAQQCRRNSFHEPFHGTRARLGGLGHST